MAASALWRGILPRTFFLFTLVAILTASQACAEIIIDDFEVGPFSFADPSPNYQTNFYTQTSLPTDHVVGGVRKMEQFGQGLPSIMSVAVGAGDDSLDLTIPNNSYGSYTISWYGTADNFRLLNLDLSSESQFEMTLSQIAHTLRVRMMVMSDSGNTSDSITVERDEAGTIVVPFSEFEGVNWSDVDGIRVSFSTFERNPPFVQSISDFRITVPEPSTIALLAIALFACACTRRVL